VRSGHLTQLRSGDGEYYGLSWRHDAISVGHSHVNNEELLTHGDLASAGRGDVVSYAADGRVLARTQRRLLLAHQIEWTDDRLLVIDTGRERLSVYGVDGDLIGEVSLGARNWDRDPDGRIGHHFNSLHSSGDRVWVVAHNHDRPSEVWELSWPDLELVEVHVTDAAWAHNIWDCDLGLITCDSRFGSLREVHSGETIWTADEDDVITRGLAVTSDHLFIGSSEFRGRGERLVNAGGLWIVDRSTLTTVEQLRFPGIGCVNEIRLLDGGDECHNGEPFDDRLLAGLYRPSHEEDLNRQRRALDPVHASASWRVNAPLRAAEHGIQSLQPSGRVPAVLASDRSLMAWWSVNQVWGVALALCAVIAVTDAILTHVVLITLLVCGPFCGFLTGRWVRTAIVGIWAVALAVLLGVPDEIWDTRTQFFDLGAIAAAALLSTVAAKFIERRQYQQIR